MAEPEQQRRRVQSIEVGFRVLRVLRTADGPLPLREIVARASMPPSKAHLYLVSFVREGMVCQDALTGHYGFGSFAIQLGLAAIRQLDVVSLASEALSDLRDKTDCAVYLSLWGNRGPCIVSRADGRLQGSLSVQLGYILPPMTTATGLVFLAHLPRYQTTPALEAQRAYDAANGTHTPSEEEIADELGIVRKQGYASTVGKLNRNFAGIAAPIHDHEGNLAATLTLLGYSEFLGKARHKEFVRLLLDACLTVSQRMGAPPAEHRRGAASE